MPRGHPQLGVRHPGVLGRRERGRLDVRGQRIGERSLHHEPVGAEVHEAFGTHLRLERVARIAAAGERRHPVDHRRTARAEHVHLQAGRETPVAAGRVDVGELRVEAVLPGEHVAVEQVREDRAPEPELAELRAVHAHEDRRQPRVDLRRALAHAGQRRIDEERRGVGLHPRGGGGHRRAQSAAERDPQTLEARADRLGPRHCGRGNRDGRFPTRRGGCRAGGRSRGRGAPPAGRILADSSCSRRSCSRSCACCSRSCRSCASSRSRCSAIRARSASSSSGEAGCATARADQPPAVASAAPKSAARATSAGRNARPRCATAARDRHVEPGANVANSPSPPGRPSQPRAASAHGTGWK